MLTRDEHISLAKTIDEFRKKAFFSDRSLTNACRTKSDPLWKDLMKLNGVLDSLKSRLDGKFCTQFPDEKEYRISPYYGHFIKK
jgi:hypothetical protein